MVTIRGENIDSPSLQQLIANELLERGYPNKARTTPAGQVKGGWSPYYLESNVGCPPRNQRIWVYFREDGALFTLRVSGEEGMLAYEVSQPDSIDRFLADFVKIWDTISIQSWTKT